MNEKKKTKKQIEKERMAEVNRIIQEDMESKFNLSTAIANGSEALHRVSANNEKVNPGWYRAAIQAIIKYPLDMFLIEEVREWAYANGLAQPTDHRAFGHVTSSLQRNGFMYKHSKRRSKHIDEHGQDKTVWKKELNGKEYTGAVTVEEAEALMVARGKKRTADKKADRMKKAKEKREAKKNDKYDY